jgi:hypothetical protein
MEPRTIARVIAVGRIGFGAGFLVAPGAISRRWIGRDGRRPGSRTLATGLGARDLALGAGVLASLANGGARPWLIASAAGDLGDLVGTLRSRRDLPAPYVAGVSLLAGSVVAAGAWLSAQDDW